MKLTKKYRPKSFDDFFPSVDNIEPLRKIAESKEGGVYLFSGPHGLGKTTTARILACEYLGFEVESEERKLIMRSGNSAGVEGYIEWDCTRNNRADDINTLVDMIEAAAQPSLMDTKYAFVIDELHNVKPETQRRLIKLFEDGDIDRVLFIVLTNYRDKLDPAVVNRSVEPVTFRPMSKEWGIKLIMDIAKREKVDITKESALDIYNASATKSPRDLVLAVQGHSLGSMVYDSSEDPSGNVKAIIGAIRDLAEVMSFDQPEKHILDTRSRELYLATVSLVRTYRSYDAVVAAIGRFYEASFQNLSKVDPEPGKSSNIYIAIRSAAQLLDRLKDRPATYSYQVVDLCRIFYLAAEDRAKLNKEMKNNKSVN